MLIGTENSQYCSFGLKTTSPQYRTTTQDTQPDKQNQIGLSDEIHSAFSVRRKIPDSHAAPKKKNVGKILHLISLLAATLAAGSPTTNKATSIYRKVVIIEFKNNENEN
mmetsp:Transcript_24954/g.28426  ORF Transcript_24954/g.28426 Transcript_24954/m.28426 type:complete len:109 (-) Transcript_24954:479-805(-)